MFLNVALSIFLGTVLGIGVALLAEIANRRVRSAKDLAEAIGAGVLGHMLQDKGAKRAMQRRKQTKKAASGSSTMAAASAR